MKIKKIAQGLIKGLILNKKSDSIADTYSCDYINKQNSYSTEEQVIGTWIDGSNIYQKTIVLNSGWKLNKEITLSHSIENFDKLIKYEGVAYRNDNKSQCLPNLHTRTAFYITIFDITNTNFTIYVGDGFTGNFELNQIVITFKYLKK